MLYYLRNLYQIHGEHIYVEFITVKSIIRHLCSHYISVLSARDRTVFCGASEPPQAVIDIANIPIIIIATILFFIFFLLTCIFTPLYIIPIGVISIKISHSKFYQFLRISEKPRKLNCCEIKMFFYFFIRHNKIHCKPVSFNLIFRCVELRSRIHKDCI